MIQTQFNSQIQMVVSDNGCEYFGQVIHKYFEERWIIYQCSCVDTPSQNGIAERKN